MSSAIRTSLGHFSSGVSDSAPAREVATTRPEALRRELRQSRDLSVRRRRRIIAFSLTAATSLGAVLLYQVGLLRHLPDPPLPHFDSDKVTASEEAYGRVGVPDAALGLGSCAVTSALAAVSGREGSASHVLLPLARAAKATVDAGLAAKLARDQWVRHGAFCSWCLIAGAAMAACLFPALADARRAFRQP